jgi:hypothetical protein
MVCWLYEIHRFFSLQPATLRNAEGTGACLTCLSSFPSSEMKSEVGAWWPTEEPTHVAPNRTTNRISSRQDRLVNAPISPSKAYQLRVPVSKENLDLPPNIKLSVKDGLSKLI